MAQIIYENREFKNRETGIVTAYDYIAIKGTGEAANFEVQLKNLVQSEKAALSMLLQMENGKGIVDTRKANNDEDVTVKRDKADDFFNGLED